MTNAIRYISHYFFFLVIFFFFFSLLVIPFSSLPFLLDVGSDATSSIPLLSSLDLEDEEDWLKGLQDFISDVTSTGATSSLQSLSGTSSLAVNTENGEVNYQLCCALNYNVKLSSFVCNFSLCRFYLIEVTQCANFRPSLDCNSSSLSHFASSLSHLLPLLTKC